MKVIRPGRVREHVGRNQVQAWTGGGQRDLNAEVNREQAASDTRVHEKMEFSCGIYRK